MDNQNDIRYIENTRDLPLKDLVAQVQNANIKNYISNRILPQLNWYSNKSKKNKKQYYFWMTVSIILGAVIPVVSILADGKTWVKVVIAALGASVTAINTFISLHNFRDLWITYRKNREILLRTLYCYFNNAGIFSQSITQQEKDILLVNICEEEISCEINGWQSLMEK